MTIINGSEVIYASVNTAVSNVIFMYPETFSFTIWSFRRVTVSKNGSVEMSEVTFQEVTCSFSFVNYFTLLSDHMVLNGRMRKVVVA